MAPGLNIGIDANCTLGHGAAFHHLFEVLRAGRLVRLRIRCEKQQTRRLEFGAGRGTKSFTNVLARFADSPTEIKYDPYSRIANGQEFTFAARTYRNRLPSFVAVV